MYAIVCWDEREGKKGLLDLAVLIGMVPTLIRRQRLRVWYLYIWAAASNGSFGVFAFWLPSFLRVGNVRGMVIRLWILFCFLTQT